LREVLVNMGERMEAHGISVAGEVREHNEDRFLVDRRLGLAAVADGMGGHAGGEIASAAALSALASFLDAHAPARTGAGVAGADPDATDVDPRWHGTVLLRQAVECANHLVYEENRMRGRGEGKGMGTTLTGLRFLPELDAFALFHVGDSRLYRYRDGRLVQLTRDQTAYQLALESGAPGALPPQNLLLQAIGPAAAVVPDLGYHELLADDLLLICSDGLHGWVPHAEIEALLAREPALDAACAGLVELARTHSSRDNVTALLVRFRAATAPVQEFIAPPASNRASPT
jgi:protein phosphatase